MESKGNKQKTQAAEEQVSYPPQQPKEPHPFISVIPLAVLITLIVMVVKLFPDDALAGASQVALMIATAVCVALGMGIYNMKWNIFEEMIKKTVGDAGVSILILLLIGMMSATWMISGVVPTLIYYGVQIMSPTFFLPCACIISSIISVMTGTSWTTIATIGIALMGIGDALGIPAPYTAGAIISGAYITAKSLFERIMITCYTHTQVDCGMENINELVATRGMAGMLNTIWLILCAMCFDSCMVASGMLHAITHMLLKSIHSTVSLVCSTVTSGVLLNLVMGDQFLSIIMNASIYKDEYAERGYRPELLSRSTEDSATVTSVLVPWTACGMTQSTVLGIPTLVYLPFCFFNIISPLMSCLVAILGFVPKPQPKEDKAPAMEESDIH